MDSGTVGNWNWLHLAVTVQPRQRGLTEFRTEVLPRLCSHVIPLSRVRGKTELLRYVTPFHTRIGAAKCEPHPKSGRTCQARFSFKGVSWGERGLEGRY